MNERESITGLLRLGWSERRIARETGFHRATIRRIAREASAGPPAPATVPEVATDPGGGTLSAQKVATESRPGSPAEAVADPRSRSVCEAHRAFIEAEVAKGRNAVAIYQDLVEHHGYDRAYNAVKRFVGKLRPTDPKISCRFETELGAEAQVDYGEGAPTRHPRTGKYCKPRLFVMKLSNSRAAFRTTVWNSSSETWCKLHEAAFAKFGGVPKTIRLDNLKEGVLKPDLYDPQLNALYAAFLEHHGVVALPCRPYAPDLKGKIESEVGYTQDTALKGRRFESIEEQNAHLERWDERWAMTRIHGTTKRQVRTMFEEERPFLSPLPAKRFEYYRICPRVVHFDAHVEVDGAYYSAPPRYVGGKVTVQVGRLWLRIVDSTTHECIREHPIAQLKGQRRTHDDDRPKQTPPKLENLVARIAGAGPSCGAFAHRLVDERGAVALRALFGMLDLLRRYEVDAVERACSFAATANSSSLRFVRTYLEHHATPLTLKTQDRIIAEIETYTKHFATLTQGVRP
ncbi:MAG: IS21 family transposase [Candidatus Binataceae bacterium]